MTKVCNGGWVEIGSSLTPVPLAPNPSRSTRYIQNINQFYQKTCEIIWLPEVPVVYLGMIKMKRNMENNDTREVLGGLAGLVIFGTLLFASFWILH